MNALVVDVVAYHVLKIIPLPDARHAAEFLNDLAHDGRFVSADDRCE